MSLVDYTYVHFGSLWVDSFFGISISLVKSLHGGLHQPHDHKYAFMYNYIISMKRPELYE